MVSEFYFYRVPFYVNVDQLSKYCLVPICSVKHDNHTCLGWTCLRLTLVFFFCRYDRHCISFLSLYPREAPNHRSLQSELQDVQQVGKNYHLQLPLRRCPVSFDLSSPASASPTFGRHQATPTAQARGWYSEHHPQDQVCRHIQTPAPEVQREGEERQHTVVGKVWPASGWVSIKCVLSQTQNSAGVETPEKPLDFRQQQQASVKQQLVNVYVSFFFIYPPCLLLW